MRLLRSDGRSATADYTGLGRDAIDLTRSHARDTSNKIQTLIAQNKNLNLDKPLATCLHEYNVDVPDAWMQGIIQVSILSETLFQIMVNFALMYCKLSRVPHSDLTIKKQYYFLVISRTLDMWWWNKLKMQAALNMWEARKFCWCFQFGKSQYCMSADVFVMIRLWILWNNSNNKRTSSASFLFIY